MNDNAFCFKQQPGTCVYMYIMYLLYGYSAFTILVELLCIYFIMELSGQILLKW